MLPMLKPATTFGDRIALKRGGSAQGYSFRKFQVGIRRVLAQMSQTRTLRPSSDVDEPGACGPVFAPPQAPSFERFGMFELRRTSLSLVGVFALSVAAAQACSAGSNNQSSDDGAGASGNPSGTGGLALTGGSDGVGGLNQTTASGGSDSCAETNAEANEGALPADVIFVVDNSGSMGEEAVEVQQSMNDLVSTIVAANIDLHLILISADSSDSAGICVPAPVGNGQCPADENLPAFRHVVQPVGSTDALIQILNTYDQYKDSLRPNASKTLVVISDDDSSMSANDFTTQLVALDPTFQGFKFDAIVSPYELANPLTCFSCAAPACACDPCCGVDSSAPFPICVELPADEGVVYKNLVSQTMGVLGDLCQQQFLPVFQDMATAVINSSAIPCVYDIPEPPGGEEIDYGKVNVEFKPDASSPGEPILNVPGGAGDCDAAGGWYYDDAVNPTQILLCPATCDAVQGAGGSVTVKFGCATQIK
jgi:von Willebrand factor type A domain